MLQCLRASQALLFLKHQEVSHEILRFSRCLQPGCTLLLEVSGANAPDDLLSEAVPPSHAEGVCASDQDVEHNTERPSVCRKCSPLVSIDLWRRVGERADVVHTPRPCVAQAGGCTKVTELQCVFLRRAPFAEQEEVLGLQVAMHDALGVQVADCPKHLPKEDPRLELVEAAASGGTHPLGQAPVKLTATAELKDDVQGPPVLEAFVHPDNVWMLEGRQHHGLFMEARTPLYIIPLCLSFFLGDLDVEPLHLEDLDSHAPRLPSIAATSCRATLCGACWLPGLRAKQPGNGLMDMAK
mmetsp:Transcript_5375/g.16621  ORF Transcript_5375/g.16621 Transcript_5375/m.16621 type:complete len:297 (+) Transcript_5375:805-1695(+)